MTLGKFWNLSELWLPSLLKKTKPNKEVKIHQMYRTVERRKWNNTHLAYNMMPGIQQVFSKGLLLLLLLLVLVYYYYYYLNFYTSDFLATRSRSWILAGMAEDKLKDSVRMTPKGLASGDTCCGSCRPAKPTGKRPGHSHPHRTSSAPKLDAGPDTGSMKVPEWALLP